MADIPGRKPGRNAQEGALDQPPSSDEPDQPFALLALAVLGVVYGDIGTSPIYALRESFAGAHSLDLTRGNVLGVLSLVFWTLVLVVSLKYIVFMLRADNRGEGGIFALIALLQPDRPDQRSRRRLLILFGVLGACMLYGGAMITPAISVLSAIEGLGVAEPQLQGWVIPITLGVLVTLFTVQRYGTARVGEMFGPLTLIWFSVLAVLGLRGIVQEPEVLLALDPRHAIRYFSENGLPGYAAMYAVFLVATGAEALYADLGHFGRRPIRIAWFGLVLPALLLNYFGQGALLIADPVAASAMQPFFHLAPQWALYPLILLATIATCIASQAVITGSYSLTRQAMQLDLVPRLRVRQTAADARGQIYVPAVNWILMAAAVGLVLIFRSSGNLAAAYGLAVNATMVVTTVLAYVVAREQAGWSLPRALVFLALFLAIDLTYLGSNLHTIPHGGWLPLAIGVVLFAIMTTWRTGSSLVAGYMSERTPDVETFIHRLEAEQAPRLPGTAVFVTGRLHQTPPALQLLTEHIGALHERVILVSVVTEPIPRTEPEQRIDLSELGAGFYRLILHYGFMQRPNLPSDLAECAAHGLDLDLDQLHYFISKIDMVAGRKRHGMVLWRDKLFTFMSTNTEDVTVPYQIPSHQRVDIGFPLGI
jgi:KUP system potassium uptake protein